MGVCSTKKLVRWDITPSFSVDKHNPPRCRICGEKIYQESYLNIAVNKGWRNNTKGNVHTSCMEEFIETAKSITTDQHRKKIEKRKEEYQADVAKCSEDAAKAREEAEFYKSIIKEALKSQHLKISKMSICRYSGRGRSKHGRAKMYLKSSKEFKLSTKDKTWGALLINFSEDKVTLWAQWYGSSLIKSNVPTQIVNLNGPNGIKKLGEAIMKFDSGVLKNRFQKKPSGR